MKFTVTSFTTAVLACVSLAAAVPTNTPPHGGSGGGSGNGGNNCNTGPIQCCNSVKKGSDAGVGLLLGLLGIVLQDLNVLVGLTCSPVTVIGGGSNACSANPVCCQNNNFNGLIAIGCVPISIGI